MITGKQLMDRWKIRDFELLECIKRGLRPYSPTYKRPFAIPPVDPIVDPLIYQGVLKLNPEEFNPYIDLEVQHMEILVPHLSICLFRRKDVEEFERKYGLHEQEEKRVVEKDSQGLDELKKREYSPNFIELVKKARLEGAFLFDNMKAWKKEGNLNERVQGEPEYSDTDDYPPEDLEGELKEETIKAFNQQKDSFKWVKIEYLKNKEIYKMSYRKDKRDFIGKLLQKIVKDKYPEKREWWGRYQDLYELSNKIKKGEIA